MSVRRTLFRRAGTLALIGSGFFLLSAASASAQCVGDCDGNGTVQINELIIGVNIALEAQPVSACEVFACTDGNSVPINCLIQGVNNALAGCNGNTPVPTPTGGTVATPTATQPPNDCPLDEGEYTITSGAGGRLRVATLSEFAFPSGGRVVMDATGGDENCVHDVIVPADGGFFSPVFCIQVLGFSVQVEQTGCGIGQIDSDGGSDYTVSEIGDTSDASGTCNLPQNCPVPPVGQDSSVRVDITVGDGTTDPCTSGGTGNAIVAIPVHTTTWLEAGSTCPAADGTFNEGPDTLISEFDQILDFTTDGTTTRWMDIDEDGCFVNGAGPANGFGSPASTGACLNIEASTVTTVASGPVGSIGSPLYDLTFVTTLPNAFERTADRTGATCETPPVINFGGEATRCLTAE